jgi:hypothetical protein
MNKLFSDPDKKSKNKNNDTDTLMKKQQASTEKLNSLLEQSLTALSCGPDCQKIKIEGELKQKYMDAQTNLQTAPVQLETTKKNYYVYTEGRPYYDNMLEEELKKKADTMGQLLAENFHDEISNANTMNSYYNTALTNSSYTKELYKVYLEKNKLMQDTIRQHHGDVLTNDRKTYYETEAIEELRNWYSFFWYVYYIILFTVFSYVLFFKTQLNIFIRIIIFIIFIFYPYYIDAVLRHIYYFFHSLWKQLPKNVYNDL